MKQIILVADFGSSNVRVHAIDAANGRIVAQHALKYPVLSPRAGYFEHDPEEMWNHSVECVQKVYHEIKEDGEVKALSFSHIGSSLVLMDEQGHAVYNCILGMDSRAAEEGAWIHEEAKKRNIHAETCLTYSAVSPMGKLLSLRKFFPKETQKARYVVSIQQYILRKLGLPLVWDQTEAGSHSCYDVMKREWASDVLDIVGIDSSALGTTVQSHEIVGTISGYGDVAFDKPVPVVIGGHDAVMGTVGLGVYDENKDTIAEVTGSVDVYCFLMNRTFNASAEQQAQMRPGAMLITEPGPLKLTTMCMTGFTTAGALIEWYLREIYHGRTERPFEDLWSHIRLDGTVKTKINPNFTNAGGVIRNIDLSTTQYDIYSACIEAITFESRAMAEICERMKSGGCHRVRVGGGQASSDAWTQFRTDVTGKIYERMENNEVSALGTAVLAAYGVGLYEGVEEAVEQMVRIRDVFTPNEKVHERYQEIYQKYLEA